MQMKITPPVFACKRLIYSILCCIFCVRGLRKFPIDKSIFFENNVRFACVCAFFVVPLQPILERG